MSTNNSNSLTTQERNHKITALRALIEQKMDNSYKIQKTEEFSDLNLKAKMTPFDVPKKQPDFASFMA